MLCALTAFGHFFSAMAGLSFLNTFEVLGSLLFALPLDDPTFLSDLFHYLCDGGLQIFTCLTFLHPPSSHLLGILDTFQRSESILDRLSSPADVFYPIYCAVTWT